MQFEKTYNSKETEQRIQEFWVGNDIFGFDVNSKKPIFSIDTPPPTISGKMHIGHSFSYSQTDFIARYKRMQGYNLFYPFGTDDNGLATERLIEKINGIKSTEMSRKDFIKLCLNTLVELRKEYIKDFKSIGLSCDWKISYTTIDEHCRKISQKSFIDLYKLGREYRMESPVIWCPECQTAIAQAELKDTETESYFNDIIFKINGKDFAIATTRPELLPACVAIFVHPNDKRYKDIVGKKIEVPLFNFEVPILTDEKVDLEKGTGIVMCCTFGDQTDAEWYKAYKLPLKMAITKDGKMTEIAKKYAGLRIKEARKRIIEDLRKEGLLVKQEKITHVLNVHERCGTEIEILKTKQWFIKYMDLKSRLSESGMQLNWHPEHMINRYENWIRGLQWDWCISRQRFFGVPIPVWYCKKCDEVILADESQLPVDPIEDKPNIDKCPKCDSVEFIPEKDVLDTWATSSLTPKLAIDLLPNKPFEKLFPMSLRPQAHDIITFWLFNTVVKSQLHYKKNPWKDVMISGWVLDPKGEKMSKSKGNTIEPQEIVKKYCADALRFWAASAKLGEDVSFQEKELVTAQKTITKLWNASKLIMQNLDNYSNKKPKKLEVIDQWLLAKLSDAINTCTDALDNYDYFSAKASIDQFFWKDFCDNYLEIIKHRLYNPDETTDSAKYTLYESLLAILKLFAPIMPYITEELYQSFFKKYEKIISIHVSNWPTIYEIDDGSKEIGEKAKAIIVAIRQWKNVNKLALNTELASVTIDSEYNFDDVINDIKGTMKIKEIEIGKAEDIIIPEHHIKLDIVK
ncbi:MAG: valine--tRNA ligase [Nanoarchaeota archaeon]|nr:valine--tRNA ligase [Nanoarchaeota archaeon]MBU4124438.1 valine--tRNA ligase [Nanoarchaeota archaeon]